MQKHMLEEMPLKFPNLSMPPKKLSGNQPPNSPRLITKPPKTFSIVWPAIIFANKRTDKLTGLLRVRNYFNNCY